MKKLVAVAFVVLTAAAASAATRYQFVTITVPGSVPYSTIPMGINNEYMIAGYYQDSATFGWHGFTYNLKKRTCGPIPSTIPEGHPAPRGPRLSTIPVS
jgi:hypothetical protein